MQNKFDMHNACPCGTKVDQARPQIVAGPFAPEGHSKAARYEADRIIFGKSGTFFFHREAQLPSNGQPLPEGRPRRRAHSW